VLDNVVKLLLVTILGSVVDVSGRVVLRLLESLPVNVDALINKELACFVVVGEVVIELVDTGVVRTPSVAGGLSVVSGILGVLALSTDDITLGNMREVDVSTATVLLETSTVFDEGISLFDVNEEWLAFWLVGISKLPLLLVNQIGVVLTECETLLTDATFAAVLPVV
jgi:hypothetical protein